MNKHLATFILGRLDEFNGVIEHALDIFMHVVLQVIALILDAFINEVVLTVVRSTVDNVGDAHLSQLLLVSGHQVPREK